jgi:hypothetical protein
VDNEVDRLRRRCEELLLLNAQLASDLARAGNGRSIGGGTLAVVAAERVEDARARLIELRLSEDQCHLLERELATAQAALEALRRRRSVRVALWIAALIPRRSDTNR